MAKQQALESLLQERAKRLAPTKSWVDEVCAYAETALAKERSSPASIAPHTQPSSTPFGTVQDADDAALERPTADQPKGDYEATQAPSAQSQAQPQAEPGTGPQSTLRPGQMTAEVAAKVKQDAIDAALEPATLVTARAESQQAAAGHQSDIPSDIPWDRLAPQSTYHQWRILSCLQRRSNVVVYHAEQTALQRPVALTIWNSVLPAPRHHAIQAIARLQHPNLLDIYEFDRRDGRLLCAAEWAVDGNTRQRLDAAGPLSEDEVIDLLKQVLDGLEVLHKEGVVHGAIRPENLFLGTEGRVLLGLPHGMNDRPVAEFTRMYRAPEAVDGGEVDPQHDLYSLGVTAVTLLGSGSADTSGLVSLPISNPMAGFLSRLISADAQQRPKDVALARRLLESRERQFRRGETTRFMQASKRRSRMRAMLIVAVLGLLVAGGLAWYLVGLPQCQLGFQVRKSIETRNYSQAQIAVDAFAAEHGTPAVQELQAKINAAWDEGAAPAAEQMFLSVDRALAKSDAAAADQALQRIVLQEQLHAPKVMAQIAAAEAAIAQANTRNWQRWVADLHHGVGSVSGVRLLDDGFRVTGKGVVRLPAPPLVSAGALEVPSTLAVELSAGGLPQDVQEMSEAWFIEPSGRQWRVRRGSWQAPVGAPKVRIRWKLPADDVATVDVPAAR